MLHFYDFEVYPKLWTVTIINPVRRTETVIVNDREKLEAYYNEFKDEIFIGYNSREYDQWILKAILCGFNPKEMNEWIVVKGVDENGKPYRRRGYEFSDVTRNSFPINNYDLIKGHDGLKTLEAFMGNDIRETDIPFDYDGEFTPEMIELVLKYNRHDVLQTMEVFKYRRQEFDAQLALLDTFGLGRGNIGNTQAQLAAMILGARSVELDDEWDIRLPDTLKLDKYRHIADWFLDPANHDEDSELETEVAGVPHVFAWGGVHGAIKKYTHTCDDDEVMLMVDVDQLYPTLMIEYGLLSRAVREPERFKTILDTSLKLKAEKRKKEREPYKRICNITYGAMGDRFNRMYDPLHRKLVCIYGQLLLLDLIEKIEPICELLQSNTDGILLLLKRRDVEELKRIVGEWDARTRLHMSYDEFRKVFQGDVNNYVAVDVGGGMKSKGSYVKDLGPLDNDLPIVNRAIKEYLVNGVHPRETVMASNDLIDFQKVVKVSNKYAYATLNGERLMDKTFRVFASRRRNDGLICKVKTEGANPEKFANTPTRCFIWNDSVTGIAVPPYLDREYYVELTETRLREKFGVTP